MGTTEALFVLYVKLAVFDFDERYNATACLSDFSVHHGTITFEVTKINTAFRIADALGRIEADFSLDLNYNQPFALSDVTQSRVLPDAITFAVRGWNQQKLARQREKIVMFNPFL